MKILLVVPASDAVRVTRKGEVPKRGMLRFGVLALTTIAALTPRKHQVAICDENVEPLDLGSDADVVGITFMTGHAVRAYEIARLFRARGKIVIGGGYHATLNPDEAAAHFDAIVAGEAEGVWPAMLEEIEAGGLRRKIYRRDPPGDLSDVPIPRRDLVEGKARRYATIHAIQTGRGCNHGCRFCSVTAFHHQTHRSRPLANVLEELRQAPRDFMFLDDNIIADPEYARALFTALLPMRKRWISQCSIKIADDPELLALARKAGCRGLFIGIESISERNLAAMDKGFNDSARYLERIAAIRRTGIGVIAGMIAGMDGDDLGVFERTLRFLQRAKLDALQLAILTPQPGTPLYDDMEKAGRITDHDWRHYDFRHTVIRPARMSAAELQEGADWIYSQFYRLDRILWRFARGVFTIGWVPALLSLKIGLTYRYDNIREGVVGRNPAAQGGQERGLHVVLRDWISRGPNAGFSR